MFADELSKIKESETYADDLQKKAKADAKAAVAEAKLQAEQLLREAELQEKQTFDTLMHEGKVMSDEAYEQALAQTRDGFGEMITKAEENKEKAIDLIVERIVSASVNH